MLEMPGQWAISPGKLKFLNVNVASLREPTCALGGRDCRDCYLRLLNSDDSTVDLRC